MSDAKTPSSGLIASARKEDTTTDARGRKITFRRLGALDRARLFKAIGSAQSANAPYVGMAMLAASVTQVDEWPAPFPTRDSEVEMLIARLDDDGLEAVAAALVTEQIAKAIAEADEEEKKRAESAGVQPA